MALSQMMQHYFQVKEAHKDCIIFYRLGDFYEMFFDDAVKVSRLLDLTLTGRDCGLSDRAPMCGIPYHAAEGYIAKLVSFGEKVAICEQVSDPAQKSKASELVSRDVIRIISAGTLTEDSMLDERKNNFIGSVYKENDVCALAWADITTGEFSLLEFTGADGLQQTVDQLLKLSVAEIICNDDMLFASKQIKEVRHNLLPPFSSYYAWAFNEKHAEKNLCEQFQTQSLAAFGIAGHPHAISAAGALIEYLRETQKHALKNLTSVKLIKNDTFMTLDPIAIRNLELVKNNAENKKYGSLLWLLDKTATGMGARLMAQLILSPLNEKEGIEYRLNGVEELYAGTVVRVAIWETLKEIRDIERLAGKISNGNLTPKDCLALGDSLRVIPSLKFRLSGFSSQILKDVDKGLFDLREVADLLFRAIDPEASSVMKDGGYIKKGYNAELDEIRALHKNSTQLKAQMEEREREATGIPKLKIGFNRVFGYYIEIPNSFKDKTPEHYIRRQTLATAERYVTEELKALESKILNAEETSLRLEAQLYAEIKNVLMRNIEALKEIARSLALLDCLVSFATLAKENKYCRPSIVEKGGELKITEGRHPVVEAISRERFVPNDTVMDGADNRTMIITGPNMAGKSTYMRQTALIVLMAHLGCFVPAKAAVIPLTDRIFTRVGASDNLIFDQSTFMVEMTEVATILLHATKDSLLILDEVGRGTSTYDGLSIAWAVVEFLTKSIGAKTLFATHYHELTELEGKLEGVKNYKVTVRELAGNIVFLRKIQRGGANKSFGVEVASLAGVPKEITIRAKQILKNLERNDVNRSEFVFEEEIKELSAQERELTEVEQIIKDTDTNTLSPMQALLLLSDLKEKIENRE
ncbi:MAG: DNA mismatch repair protein MutS [Clostridia bacterium]|nr:DNA mismatch repair protein MutS [Clostridia bacterium]